MNADPLAAFRRPGSRPAAEARDPPPKAEAGGYRAFHAASAKPTRLEFRMGNGVSVFKAYASVTEIIYERKSATLIALQYSTKQFVITGANLAPVLEAIAAGTCEWVAELDAGENAPPGQPVIKRIAGGGVPAAAPAKPAPKKEP